MLPSDAERLPDLDCPSPWAAHRVGVDARCADAVQDAAVAAGIAVVLGVGAGAGVVLVLRSRRRLLAERRAVRPSRTGGWATA